MQALSPYVYTSKAHVFIEKQKENHSGKQIKELQRLSDTCWACRSLALSCNCQYVYNFIIATLYVEHIADDNDKTNRSTSSGSYLQVSCYLDHLSKVDICN